MIDFNELWEKTIQSQYANSPHIKGIIESFAKNIDPTADIEKFYTKFFDPRTAEGIGLDVWGLIVGADRYLEVDEGEYFGFFGSNLSPYDNQPFYFEKGATKVYRLADNAYRNLIFLKAYANIADATLPNIKFVINQLYNGALAITSGHMKIRAVFLSYDVPAYALALLKRYGILNIGAGVDWEYYIIEPQDTFGFDGSGLQTFDNGVFAPYSITQP